jgi:predicted MFS family arabinose efflux permease
LVKTTLLHPVVLAGAYLVLYILGSANILSMAIITLLWGATHTSGMVITQVWLTSVASEAPEFATSLFVSAGNAGVVLGSAVGGLFINGLGMPGVILCGLMFAALSVIAIGAKAFIYRGQPVRVEGISAAH